MTVYHLGRTKFALQLTGEGAKLYGGRWNTIGQPCIYTSATRSLCVLEFAANVAVDELAGDLSFTTYELPDDNKYVFETEDLPENWMETPSPLIIKDWGTKHLQSYLFLKLPSVIIPSEFNFILNPLHPDFKKVEIIEVEPFTFDARIKN